MGVKGRTWSIRWIVSLAAVAITAGATLSVGYVAERNSRIALTREIETRLLLDARTLALASTGAMLGDYPELTLHPLTKKMHANQPELSLLVVVDNLGIVQGHPDARSLGSAFRLNARFHRVVGPPPLESGEALATDGASLLASVPVTHPDGRPLGRAFVGMHRSYLEHVLAAARRQQVLVLGLFLLIGIVSALLLMAQLLRPIAALRAGIERIGSGQLDKPVLVRDRTELGLLASAINEMAIRLGQGQAEMLERQRLAQEMELARKIQQSLLPKSSVRAGAFAIEGYHNPASEVGGDFYDVFEFPDGRIGFTIADVSGKGLGGCLVMSMVFALLRSYRESIPSPSNLLAKLDEQLAQSLERGTFVTMSYGVLDPQTHRLVISSAGHNPFLLYRHADSRVERIATRGVPLGAVRGGAIRATLEDREIRLEQGDVLLQYTDGVSEAFDPTEHHQFGIDRLASLLAESAAGGPHDTIERVVHELRGWTGGAATWDDETLLVLGRDLEARVEAPKLDLKGPAEGAAEEALHFLAVARKKGRRIRLAADLDALLGIEPWVRRCPPYRAAPKEDVDLVVTALYELCANVVEHGYGSDPSRELDLWWVPGEVEDFFLLQDQGVPFRPGSWKEIDFRDPRVRKRGRGLGLQIIQRVMRRAVYHPATPEGNITLITFGASAGREQEVSRARAV